MYIEIFFYKERSKESFEVFFAYISGIYIGFSRERCDSGAFNRYLHSYTSFSLEGWKYYIKEIEMGHRILVSNCVIYTVDGVILNHLNWNPLITDRRLGGYIDVGDGCWRRNVSVAVLAILVTNSCYLFSVGHQPFVTNFKSPLSWCHQHYCHPFRYQFERCGEIRVFFLIFGKSSISWVVTILKSEKGLLD